MRIVRAVCASNAMSSIGYYVRKMNLLFVLVAKEAERRQIDSGYGRVSVDGIFWYMIKQFSLCVIIQARVKSPGRCICWERVWSFFSSPLASASESAGWRKKGRIVYECGVRVPWSDRIRRAPSCALSVRSLVAPISWPPPLCFLVARVWIPSISAKIVWVCVNENINCTWRFNLNIL